MRGSKRQRKKLAWGTRRSRKRMGITRDDLAVWSAVLKRLRGVEITDITWDGWDCTINGLVPTALKPGDVIGLRCSVKDVTP